MPVNYHTEGEVGIFTIDNGKVNVFTEEMHGELLNHLFHFLRDDSIKVGLLTGSEGKSFSAGDDLNDGDSYEAFGAEGSRSAKVMTMTRNKPIVAAINGWCLGQGFVYMSHLTDIRIAGEGARFGLPEIAYGMGGASGALRLSRHIPRTAANWIALTGEKITAEKAMQYQLINEVVSDEKVFSRALEVANMIAANPLIALQTEMDCINRCADMGKLEAMEYTMQQYERQLMLYLQSDPDAMSGIEHVNAKKSESQ